MDIVERLRTASPIGLCADAADVIETLQNRLAEVSADWLTTRYVLTACQANNKVLQELVPRPLPDNFIGFGKYYAEHADKYAPRTDEMRKFKIDYINKCLEALAQPTDDTAFKAALAAERERCAMAIEHIALTTGFVCAKHIRALGE